MNDFDIKSAIRTVPHWPKPGIMFRDITTLIENPRAFRYCIDRFKEKYQPTGITKIAGIESRGFVFGAALALELGLPFVLIRKKGKLPAAVFAQEYALEYGVDKIEVHQNSITSGDRVLIVDDLLATGGTAMAACQLVEKCGGTIVGSAFVINLPELKGVEKLRKYNPFYLVEFAGE
ncbi:adenine phosphoribosyltransferase [Candidatus Woesearchaeota archaeon]|nr:adenine phosphoribosyltransferase [Candidatus Woesearchaeota archaeon]